MPDQLLATKFFIPPTRSGLVNRPRLLKSLNSALSLPLSIITAPPGFGKTTLLAEWVFFIQNSPVTPPVCCAWVSQDTDDNVLTRFWMYAVTALQKAIEGSRSGVASSVLAEVKGLLKEPSLPYQVFLTPLINEISTLPLSIVLILDDFHVLIDPAISESVAYLVDHSPLNLHLIIASRTDPPLPFGRWRARGQVNSLRAQQLRFSQEEAVAFLNGSMGLSLTPEKVAELDQRTEGWAAGLQMAAFALQDLDADGTAQAIAAFSGRHHFMLDYFSGEILQRQSEEVQQFLLRTSVLERMCAELIVATLNDTESEGRTSLTEGQAQAMLEQLERLNLFVIPLDTERRWYRYHHLFNELLLARLRQTMGQEEEAHLRRRASAWHGRQGHHSEAIHQALLAQDYDLAADLIESPAQLIRIYEGGEVAAILKWIQELPADVIRRHLWLRLFHSRSMFYTGQTDAAEEILAEIEQQIRVDPAHAPENETLLGMVVSHKARYASVRGQVSSARQIAYQALEVLPADQIIARSFVFPTLALSAYRMGDVEEAVRLFAETAQISRQAGSRFQTVGNLTNLAIAQMAQGKLGEVIRSTREAIQESRIHAISLPEIGWLHFPLAEALYEQNALKEAETTLIEGLRLVGEGKLTDYFGLMPALLARIQSALGKVDEASAMMNAALVSARRSTVDYYVSEIEAFHARMWVERGELTQALLWAKAYQSRPQTEGLHEIEGTTLAEVLLTSNQVDEAVSLLQLMAEDAMLRGRSGREIPIRLLLALARQTLGDEQDTWNELERALFLSEPEGYLRPFLHLGEPMTKLLRSWIGLRTPPSIRTGHLEYVHKILSSFPTETHIAQPGRGYHPQLVESLTPREMDVLRLLGEGLSNREIAGRLYLSPNTLRVYTTNLYSKLEVHSRIQAVVRARALGLI